MSAIGDYIHLHTANYLKYGISKRGFGEGPSVVQVYTEQKNINQNRINKLPEIDKSTIDILNARVKQNLPEGRDGAEERVSEELSKRKFSDEFKNKLLTDINGNVDKAGLSGMVGQLPFNNALVNIEAAKAAKRRIDENINRLNSGKSAETTPQTLVNNFNDYFKALGSCLPETYLDNIAKIQNRDIFTALQSVIREMSFVEAHKATINGQWGEKTVAMCGDVSVSQALQAVNGVIKGSDVSSFQLNESIIPKIVGQKFEQDTGINLFRAHASQDKVDVQIVVNKQPLNVSVKAYSARGNTIRAHLQDVALLTSLATTTTGFANHWLNLHCASVALPGTASLDKVLEEHIKYEALVSGNLLKKGASKADTFVAIDTLKGRVYSASTKDILTGKASSNFYLRPNIGTLHIGGNDFANTWEARISKILQSVHATKISVILNVRLN